MFWKYRWLEYFQYGWPYYDNLKCKNIKSQTCWASYKRILRFLKKLYLLLPNHFLYYPMKNQSNRHTRIKFNSSKRRWLLGIRFDIEAMKRRAPSIAALNRSGLAQVLHLVLSRDNPLLLKPNRAPICSHQLLIRQSEDNRIKKNLRWSRDNRQDQT